MNSFRQLTWRARFAGIQRSFIFIGSLEHIDDSMDRLSVHSVRLRLSRGALVQLLLVRFLVLSRWVRKSD